MRVLPVQLDILITAFELLRKVHLDALVGGDDDTGGTVEFEELCEDETCGSCAEDEAFDPDGRRELVEAVDGASSWLQQRSLFVGEVVDFVEFVLFAG
jgi:hypothetical protein